MQHLTSATSLTWRGRVRLLLSRLFRLVERDTRSFVVWAEMQPIDFEGEDSSLTERDLRALK